MLAGHAWRGRRLAVGFSGGVDSVVLVHVLRALAPELGYALRAVHVHHGLSPNADRWAQFCAGVCRRWRVPLAVRKVRVLRRKEGLEAAARNARYDVLRRLQETAPVFRSAPSYSAPAPSMSRPSYSAPPVMRSAPIRR